MSACTCVLASSPGRSHRQPVFDHCSMMCVFHTGSDQILAVETTWERGYVCTVYAVGCDLANCSFPRDLKTYYMYGHALLLQQCQAHIPGMLKYTWHTLQSITLICKVALVLSQVSLCSAGLGRVQLGHSAAVGPLHLHHPSQLGICALHCQLHSSRPCRWADEGMVMYMNGTGAFV